MKQDHPAQHTTGAKQVLAILISMGLCGPGPFPLWAQTGQNLDLDVDKAIAAQSATERAAQSKTQDGALTASELEDFRRAAQNELESLGSQLDVGPDGPHFSKEEMARSEAAAEHELSNLLISTGRSEQEINKRIMDLHKNMRPQATRQWNTIRLDDALQSALVQNVGLKRAAQRKEMAGSTLRQQSAQFDPTLSMSAAYAYKNTYDRTANLTKYWRGTTNCARDECKQEYVEFDIWYSGAFQDVNAYFSTQNPSVSVPAPLTANATSAEKEAYDEFFASHDEFSFNGSQTAPEFNAFPGHPQNDVYWLQGEKSAKQTFNYLKYDNPKPEGHYPGSVQASEHTKRAPWRDTESTTFSMNVFQPLPWGASFNIQQQAIYQERYWYVDGIYKDTEAETITEYNEYWRPYDRPWSASITASASLPLPGSKYFGPFATREVDLRQALLSLEQSDQSLKNQVNSVLGQVEAAFWDLVRTAHQLDATTVQRHNMGKIAEKTQRFFDLGKVEKYALMQINARLASIREQEATALNRYELASNRLNLLLGFDRSLLFLAEGYLPNLEQPLNISLEQALNEGAVNNPILTIQQINVDSSNLNLRQKQVQTRPDVSLATSVKAAESNSQFGYESAADAYSGVIDPDNITITTQVSYNLPLKNKLARANLGQAQTQHARQEIALRQARSQIQRDIRNAYANYQSADARIRIAAENLTLANTAFRKALAKQELRSVTEYEMITKNNDLLAARTLHIDAKFARKKAEAQLLTAMGRMTTRLEGLPPSTGPHTAAAPTFPVAVR